MRLLLLCYALSGLFSLGYQVVWLRHFVDRFGSSTFTFVMVICCFIGGLGAGALASRRAAELLRRLLGRPNDLALYGVVELLVSLSALLLFADALVPVDWMGSFPYELRGQIHEPILAQQLLRVPLAAASVALPCFFMGISYPLLCHAFAERPRLPASLYAWNTFGACAAVLLLELALLRSLGTDATFLLLLAANLGLGAYFVARGGALLERCKAEPESRRPAPPSVAATAGAAAAAGGPPATAAVLFVAAAISGFLAGGLEADAFRRVHFVQIYNGSAMAFISFWSILGIFLASWSVHAAKGLRLKHVKLAYVLAFACFWWTTRVGLVDLASWLHRFSQESLERFPGLDPDGSSAILGAVFLATGAATLPPYFLISLLLPLVCIAGQRQGMHLGRVYGLNTLAFLAGMVAFSWLAPQVNMFYAFKLFTAAFAVCVVLVLVVDRGPRWLLGGSGAAVAAIALAALLTPRGFDHGYFAPGTELAEARGKVRALRGSSGFSTFVLQRPMGDTIYLDTGMMSGTGMQAKRYMKLMAHFPLLAHPAPEKALLICFGVGNTAGALASHTRLKQIDIVDLNRNILESAPEFAFDNDAVYADPRVRLIRDDGRSYLDLTDERYDLITSEPPPPLRQGISRLYSREYYAAARERLSPQGLMTQWLPIYQMPPAAGRLIVATFVQSFPHCLLVTGWSTEFLLVGSNAPIELANVRSRFGEDERALGDLHDIGMPTPLHVLARVVMSGDQLRRDFGELPVVTDQKNLLSSYWPTGRVLAFPFRPLELLEGLGAVAGPDSALRRTLLDLRRLRRVVPDFPIDSLAGPHPQGVAGAEVPWATVASLNERAEHAINAGALDEAERHFDRSLALLPDQMDVLLHRGLANAAAGRVDEALRWLRLAAERYPEYQAPHYQLAQVLATSGRHAEAVASARAALQRNARFFGAHMLLGQLLARSEPALARQHLEAAARLKPMSGLARNLLQQLAP